MKHIHLNHRRLLTALLVAATGVDLIGTRLTQPMFQSDWASTGNSQSCVNEIQNSFNENKRNAQCEFQIRNKNPDFVMSLVAKINWAEVTLKPAGQKELGVSAPAKSAEKKQGFTISLTDSRDTKEVDRKTFSLEQVGKTAEGVYTKLEKMVKEVTESAKQEAINKKAEAEKKKKIEQGFELCQNDAEGQKFAERRDQLKCQIDQISSRRDAKFSAAEVLGELREMAYGGDREERQKARELLIQLRLAPNLDVRAAARMMIRGIQFKNNLETFQSQVGQAGLNERSRLMVTYQYNALRHELMWSLAAQPMLGNLSYTEFSYIENFVAPIVPAFLYVEPAQPESLARPAAPRANIPGSFPYTRGPLPGTQSLVERGITFRDLLGYDIYKLLPAGVTNVQTGPLAQSQPSSNRGSLTPLSNGIQTPGSSARITPPASAPGTR